MAPVHPEDQLSLDVELHPNLAELEDPYLSGALSIKGSLHCPFNVQAGDQLTVQVCDADGQVIASGKLAGDYPVFKAIKDRGVTIGTERGNRARVQ